VKSFGGEKQNEVCKNHINTRGNVYASPRANMMQGRNTRPKRTRLNRHMELG